MEALARLPAIRLSSASCSRSSREVIKAAPRLSWLTISKIALFPLLWRSVRREQPPYSQMGLGAQFFRNQ